MSQTYSDVSLNIKKNYEKRVDHKLSIHRKAYKEIMLKESIVYQGRTEFTKLSLLTGTSSSTKPSSLTGNFIDWNKFVNWNGFISWNEFLGFNEFINWNEFLDFKVHRRVCQLQ